MYYNITIYVGVLLLNCPVARELFGAQKKRAWSLFNQPIF